MRVQFILALIILVTVSAPSLAFAESPLPQSSIDKKLDLMLQKIEQLERRIETLESTRRLGRTLGVTHRVDKKIAAPRFYMDSTNRGMMIDALERKTRLDSVPRRPEIAPEIRIDLLR